MKHINVKNLFENFNIGKKIILPIGIIIMYLLTSLYFNNHFFFNTEINGVNVSLKSHDDVNSVIKNYIQDYKLQLIERNGEAEEILGQDIGLNYNEKNDFSKIYKMQSPLKWLSSLLKEQEYYVDDVFFYDKGKLENRIKKLNCLNKDMKESQNPGFKYLNGSYEVTEEVYGNKIYKDKLNEAIKMSILKGKTILDLNANSCYENPKYTLSSDKTVETKNLLNKYVSTKITYIFGNQNEVLDKDTINEWLSVDDKLDVVIDEKAVREYVKSLSKKYDTVSAPRKFKTSTNKLIEVKGGFYGWKINSGAEIKALLEDIKSGQEIEKEPIYAQKALSRDENDIGNTYVEINITNQHLWFYKNGKLITQGDIVTGNPNRGNPTNVGVYMVNYKQKGATLRGANYQAKVTYWMPFNGNVGIHDATWRYSFGGDIYKRDGTHGCVNIPLYLAKIIFDKIDDGTPIICYQE